MNIAFDLHGTLDKSEKLQNLFLFLRNRNHRVYILSGSPIKIMKEELFDMNFTVHEGSLLSIEDFLRFVGISFYSRINPKTLKVSQFCDNDIWNAAKSILCMKYKIDFLIDDCREYSKFFSEDHLTKFYLYDEKIEDELIKKISSDWIF